MFACLQLIDESRSNARSDLYFRIVQRNPLDPCSVFNRTMQRKEKTGYEASIFNMLTFELTFEYANDDLIFEAIVLNKCR